MRGTDGGGRRRQQVVANGFARFCSAQGLGDPAPSHLLIEAFCAQGLAGRTDATKGTYRSVLRQRAGMVLPPARPGYSGAAAKVPYTDAERAELVAACCAQPKRWRGEAALVVLALGVGAGLRAGELARACGGDVLVSGNRVTVSVTGPRARTVAVGAPFGEVVAEAARRVGHDHLFHPEPATRRYHNFVNGLLAALVCDPGTPRLSVARCRASYVCDRLAEGVGLAEVLGAAGIVEVESLLRYARLVEGAPGTKAALRRALAEGR